MECENEWNTAMRSVPRIRPSSSEMASALDSISFRMRSQ